MKQRKASLALVGALALMAVFQLTAPRAVQSEPPCAPCIDKGCKQPFQTAVDLLFTGEPGVSEQSFTVPAGQLLVIGIVLHQ